MSSIVNNNNNNNNNNTHKCNTNVTYHIISGDKNHVTRGINKALKTGWHLYGNPMMVVGGGSNLIRYSQAILKYEDTV